MGQCHRSRQPKWNEVSGRSASLRVPSASNTKPWQEALGLGRRRDRGRDLGGRVYVPPTGGALCLRRLITRVLISVRKQLALPSCDARVPVTDRTSMLREEADQNSPIPVLGFRLQLVCFVVIGPQRGPRCRLCRESDCVVVFFSS